MVTVYTYSRSVASLDSTFTALSRCERCTTRYTHGDTGARAERSIRVVSGPVAASNLSRAGSRVARAAWESALTSCTGVGKGAEEPRVGGWTRRGFSHRGGAKRRQTLAIGQVFVSAAGGRRVW